MSESQVSDEPRAWWKESIKRKVITLFSSALVGGSRHADYLEKLGFGRERVSLGYDVIDNDYFFSRAEGCRAKAAHLRGELDLPENYFLASARFIPKKNLASLLNAYSEYQKMAGPVAWHLVVLGDGPLRAELELLRSSLGLKDRVHFPGFKQYDEIPVYYALARCFVHASTSEQWGLVVNEAMAAGLPVVVSNRCGCAPELVREGQNGFTFDPADSASLARVLALVAERPQELESMGESSREIIRETSPVTFREGLTKAIDLARSLKRSDPGLIPKAMLQGLLSI